MMTFLTTYGSSLGFMLLLLGLSAGFSGSETALFSLSKVELNRFRKARGWVARAISFCAREPSDFLSTVLLCNTVVNILFYSLSTGMSIQMALLFFDKGALQHTAEFAFSILTLLLVIIFGEVTPKSLAVLAPVGFLRFSVLPMAGLHWSLTPIRRGLRWMTHLADLLCPRKSIHERKVDELNLMFEALASMGELSHSDSSIVSEVIELPHVRLRECMTPRVKVEMAPQHRTVEEVMAMSRASGNMIVPVFSGFRDNIIGIADVRKLLLRQAKGSIVPYLEPPAYLSEYGRADEALRWFIAERREVGIVVDEYGGTAGLLTLQNLLAQIFPDIQRAMEGALIRQLSPGEFLLAGTMSLREFSAWLPEAESLIEGGTTVAGVVTALLGHVPALGDTVVVGRIRFTIHEMIRHHVSFVRLEVLSDEVAINREEVS